MQEFFGVSTERLLQAGSETVYMVGWALFYGTIIGIPLAIILVLTRNKGILENKFVYWILNGVINLVRSVPFIILLVTISPFTKALIGTRIGTKAAVVPLTLYIAPYIARLVENSLLDVDQGIIEAAQAMGASTVQTIWHFMLPEALGSLVLAMTTGTIGLLGATAMAGAIGGGGVGDLALTYGYQRFNNAVMMVTVVVLIILVQLLQSFGNWLSKKIRTHD